MAEALFNCSAAGHHAWSVGTDVDLPGETLLAYRERVGAKRSYVIPVMSARGYDVTAAVRTPLTVDLLGGRWDLVISMAEFWAAPLYLRDDPRYVYWHVPDPGGKSFRATADAEEVIAEMVDVLLGQLRRSVG